jgi:hypothetical protein
MLSYSMDGDISVSSKSSVSKLDQSLKITNSTSGQNKTLFYFNF